MTRKTPSSCTSRTGCLVKVRCQVIRSKLEARVSVYWDNGKENGNYYLGFRVLGLGLRAARVQVLNSDNSRVPSNHGVAL